ncbi:borealin [Protopterus annectens]|uniref:borealin n=1 Tax=Protopterus annectens TaxID=7888 RepID=UPI001CF9373E|nr:borealin [Protopterus annectens]
MAPARKKTATRGRKVAKVKNDKVIAFLKDFDNEVRLRLEVMKTAYDNLLKEVDTYYNIELLKLPPSVRQMSWLDYFGAGGKTRAVEEAVKTGLNIKAEVAHIPIKSTRKGKKKNINSNTVIEDAENIPISAGPKVGKAKVNSKKLSASTKKTKVLLETSVNAPKRQSRKVFTPAFSRSCDISVWGPTPLITPKFDPRQPNTPAARSAKPRERIFTFSASGSPIAVGDVVVSVPAGDGEVIQLMASDMDTVDIANLDQKALHNIQMLSNRLSKLCEKVKRQK